MVKRPAYLTAAAGAYANTVMYPITTTGTNPTSIIYWSSTAPTATTNTTNCWDDSDDSDRDHSECEDGEDCEGCDACEPDEMESWSSVNGAWLICEIFPVEPDDMRSVPQYDSLSDAFTAELLALTDED